MNYAIEYVPIFLIACLACPDGFGQGVLAGVKGYSFLRNEYEMNPSAAAGHIYNEDALEEKGVRRAIVVPLSFRGTNITPQGSLSIVHRPSSTPHLLVW